MKIRVPRRKINRQRFAQVTSPSSSHRKISAMNELIEKARLHLNEKPEDLEEQTLLNEIISLRTGAIALGLSQTKRYANQIDQQVRSLQGDAGKLKRSKTPENTNDALADALETIGSLFYLTRKMNMYSALTSAATGVGVDRGYKLLQKIEKEKKRR